MIFINKVCLELDRHGVRYAIVGGYGVALHGAVRGTIDIDIVVNWDLHTLRKTEKALGSIGLVSRLPINSDDVYHFRDEYINKRNLVAWNFYHPEDISQLVDIIITYDLRGKRRQVWETLEGQIQVLKLPDLIEMKRASGRAQDLEDVKALERLQ